MHTHMREGTHTHGWTDAPHTAAALACRIRKHFQYLLNKKPAIKEEELLTQLSPDLKAEVLIHSRNSLGRSTPQTEVLSRRRRSEAAR